MKKIIVILSLVLLAASCNKTVTQQKELNNQPASQPSPVNFAYVDNETGHVIYNGKDLGAGASPVLDGNDIAFTDPNSHLIYNSKDLGEGIFSSKEGGGIFYPPILNSGHVAFYRMVKGVFHVIYDGKDLGGTVGSPVLEGSNLALITAKGNHIIYNGKDLGLGFSPILSNGHIAYVTEPNTPSHVIYDGKDFGSGYAPIFAGSSFGYISQSSGADHMIFNGKDLGEGGYPCDMNEKHIACVRSEKDGNHIIYDGKDLGIGNNPKLDGDNIAYDNLNLGLDNYSIMYNGRIIGQGARLVLDKGNYAYEKAVNGQDYSNTTLVYNGKDLGPVAPTSIQLLDNNLAYSVVDGGQVKTVFNEKTIDGGSFVMTRKQ
jgi:hypothetical protein